MKKAAAAGYRAQYFVTGIRLQRLSLFLLLR